MDFTEQIHARIERSCSLRPRGASDFIATKSNVNRKKRRRHRRLQWPELDGEKTVVGGSNSHRPFQAVAVDSDSTGQLEGVLCFTHATRSGNITPVHDLNKGDYVGHKRSRRQLDNRFSGKRIYGQRTSFCSSSCDHGCREIFGFAFSHRCIGKLRDLTDFDRARKLGKLLAVWPGFIRRRNHLNWKW